MPIFMDPTLPEPFFSCVTKVFTGIRIGCDATIGPAKENKVPGKRPDVALG
jgi:hypothetical protein